METSLVRVCVRHNKVSGEVPPWSMLARKRNFLRLHFTRYAYLLAQVKISGIYLINYDVIYMTCPKNKGQFLFCCDWQKKRCEIRCSMETRSRFHYVANKLLINNVNIKITTSETFCHLNKHGESYIFDIFHRCQKKEIFLIFFFVSRRMEKVILGNL